MADRTVNKRMAAMRERRKEAGVVQVQVYVHETRRDDIRAVAATMQTPKEQGGNDG